MDDPSIEAPASVELALLEFPAASFDGSIATALAGLVDKGIVSIIDLLLVARTASGDLEVIELSDAENQIAAQFEDVDGEVLWLLSDADVRAAASNLAPGTTGLLVVWENIWARHLRDAVESAGGRLVLHDRLDADEVAAAMSAEGG
jgi:hypothetical protein